MNKKALKFFEDIFGKGKVDYYKKEIDNALNLKGKYKDSHGLIHSGIILYINSAGEDFVSKASAYEVLESFIKGKDTINYKNVLIPAPPDEVLKLAKKYIDKFKD